MTSVRSGFEFIYSSALMDNFANRKAKSRVLNFIDKEDGGSVQSLAVILALMSDAAEIFAPIGDLIRTPNRE